MLTETEWRERITDARRLMSPCELCPRCCHVDRLQGKKGACGVGAESLVASAGPHFGEEPVLVGYGGSGTIFLSGCNLACVFCQNADISHGRRGAPASPEQLARQMIRLQQMGCVNINWVTPTHVMPMLLEATYLAREMGLHLPIVYNCGGYESVEALRVLNGVIDIYMPDAKYASNELGEKYSGVPDYANRMWEALTEMQRQVGDLRIEGGIARRGLLVRHLVLPDHVDDSKAVMEGLAARISPRVHVNVMNQYRPCFHAGDFPELRRPVTFEEHVDVVRHARALGLPVCDVDF